MEIAPRPDTQRSGTASHQELPDAPAPNDRWPDLPIPTAPARPRIAPGCYTARSVDLKSFVGYRRRCLRLDFDVYASTFEAGLVMARISMFFRLPPTGKPLWPTSKLMRVFDLLGPRPRRLDRLPMDALRHRLWRVEVGDVEVSGDADRQGRHRPLHEAQRYSVVRAVLERLA